MIYGEEWCNLVERHRCAVRAYSEAVDRLSSVPGTPFQLSWRSAEKARREVDLARAALLSYERGLVPLAAGAGAGCEVVAFDQTEELVLGDQGQSGG